MSTRVVCVVRGGCLEAVYANGEVLVDLLDYDNMAMCQEDDEEYKGYAELEQEIKETDLVCVW